MNRIARRLEKSFVFALHSLERGIERRGFRLPWRMKAPVRSKLSIVVPCYNIEKYIDEFLASLLCQTTGLSGVEIIVIDDGSTDRSPEIIKRWLPRFSGHLTYHRKPNGGLSSARNAGLDLATGEWVTFMDPDDFVHRNYLHYVDKEIHANHDASLALVVCNLIIYNDAARKKEDRHPLKFRFEKRRTNRPVRDMKDHINLSVNNSWLRRDLIEREKFRFDPRCKPSFEDGQMVNRYLAANRDKSVSFLKDARYFYRKRADGSSLVDSARRKVDHYIAQHRYGYLSLLQSVHERLGFVPRFIQRTVLYDTFWTIKNIIDHAGRVSFMSEAEKGEYKQLLKEIYRFIAPGTINSFTLANCYEDHRVGLLAYFHDASPPETLFYIDAIDPNKQQMQVRFNSKSEHETSELLVNGAPQAPIFEKVIKHTFLGDTMWFEHVYWLGLPDDGIVSAFVGGKPAPIRLPKRPRQPFVLADDIREHFSQTPKINQSLKKRSLKIRSLSTSDNNPYKDCWVLMDRDDKADDNAEHLYRYLLRTNQAGGKYFALRKDSPDWARLEAEGFNLLDFGSLRFKVAVISSAYLISSHADHFIRTPVSRSVYGDLMKYKFVFLQHGVISQDLSPWLNGFKIDLMLTSTPDEFQSIVSPRSKYRMTEKEVALTGLPRHDALVTADKSNDIILIMPTWRRTLVSAVKDARAKREAIPEFMSSEYAKHWGSLLRSKSLKAIADRYGKKIVFCPHPNMQVYIDAFNVPQYVEVKNPLEIKSLQELFLKSAVLISDYSSVTFELGFLNKPVVYFHYDNEAIFKSDHVYEKGYFDYETMGFGPVAATEGKLLRSVERSLNGTLPTKYEERRLATFPFKDGRSCERAVEAILNLRRDVSVESFADPTQRSAAE